MNIINIDSLKCATEFAENENCFVSNATIKMAFKLRYILVCFFILLGMNTFKTWPKFPGTHSGNKPPDTYSVFLGEEALHLEQQGVQALDLDNEKRLQNVSQLS